MTFNKDLKTLIEQEFAKIRNFLSHQQKEILMKLQDILDEVESEKTIIEGVVTLINGLRQQVIDAAGDPDKINQIFDKMEANKAELTKALTANVEPQHN